MANSLVIRKGTSLAKRIKALRAAQYVRMSTDYQRYSIQNQAAAIAAFAQQQNLTIVRTYMDEGRSGLRIKNRPGLIELIEDVRSGDADFDHVLVYDVSRWGRFQDVDESAHYEFVCKENGVKVTYCAEQFENDGSLLSSIVKNIKRVMAAEFSRELSVKVHTGHCRIAGLGFRVGGPLTFGLRRELVGENRRSKGWLERGERKALQTDRVRVCPGSKEQVAIVRWIFHQFVIEQKTEVGIARELNSAGIASHHERPWTYGMVHYILRNENYVGNIVYNRTSRRLGQRQVNNPIDRWIRSDAGIEPVVDRNLFARAQKIIDDHYISVSEDEMLRRLRLLLKRKGKLNANIIGEATGLPSAPSYVSHFGSLRKAFALIGYVCPRDCDWIDSRQHWSDVLAEHARRVAEELDAVKGQTASTNQAQACITVNGKTLLSFQVARHLRKRGPNHVACWRVYRKEPQSGLLVVLRLDEANRAISDYVMLQGTKVTKRYLYLSGQKVHGTVCAATMGDLVAAIKASLARHRRRSNFRQSKTRG
jgi:DNA invertase Pin-like site-specific DNA recombinase